MLERVLPGQAKKTPQSKLCGVLKGFEYLVGRARFELATNGLKVRCSTD